VGPDWVLDINGYSTRRLPSLPIFSTSGYSCLPCTPGAASNSVPSVFDSKVYDSHDNKALLEGSAASSGAVKSPSSPSLQSLSPSVPVAMHLGPPASKLLKTGHAASSLMTVGITCPGNMDLRKVKVLLDSLLYSEAASMAHKISQPLDLPIPPNSSSSSVKVEISSHSGLVSKDSVVMEPVTYAANEGQSVASEMKMMTIYRLKGILHVHNDSMLYILQAVHQVFDVQPSSVTIGSPDDTSDGTNKFVVIGRNLNANFLQSSFESCLL